VFLEAKFDHQICTFFTRICHFSVILCVPMIPQQLAAGPARRRPGQLRLGFVAVLVGRIVYARVIFRFSICCMQLGLQFGPPITV
jgi:hypothetical protein